MQTAEARKDVPKVEPVFDKDDLPAGKQAAIAHLVSLSSKAAYSRTDNILSNRKRVLSHVHW